MQAGRVTGRCPSSSKEILERLQSPRTQWQSIAELAQPGSRVVIPTAIKAYGSKSRWPHALLLFFQINQLIRLDAVSISAAVSACCRNWLLALWMLQGSPTPRPFRGLTSAAVACAQQNQWAFSLMLSHGPGPNTGDVM